MLLVEITINGTVHYVSNDDYALTHLWKSEIANFDTFQIKIDSKQGGYERPSYGSITFLPSLFASDWIPPTSCPITIKYTTTTEAAAATLVDGTAHLQKIGQDGITYGLYADEYDTSISGQVFNDTLVNVVTWACDSSRLNLTVDSSLARAPSPTVSYTTSDVVLINELSNICAGNTHRFKIDKATSTLYLVDMLKTGTPTEITEFDVLPSEYGWPVPYSKVKAGDFSVDGSYSYGNEATVTAYHGTQANVETELANIKTILELPEALFKYPNIANAPLIGDFITLSDDSLEGRKTTTILINELNYDFNADTCVAKGLAVTHQWVDTDVWDDTEVWED